MKTLATGREVPVELQTRHETNSQSKALPNLGERAVEEVKAQNEGIRHQHAPGELVQVPKNEEFHFVEALHSEFVSCRTSVDEEARDSAKRGGCRRIEGALLILICQSSPSH